MTMVKALGRLIMLLSLLAYGEGATIFTVVNKCSFTIWPAFWTQSGGGGGTELSTGQAWTLATYPAWSGRVWARTGCRFAALGQGFCSSGDCGGFDCSGSGPPGTTLFEVTLDPSSRLDFYDLSVIGGFNLPLVVLPSNFNCPPLACQDSNFCPDAARYPSATNIKTCPYGGDYTLYFCAT